MIKNVEFKNRKESNKFIQIYRIKHNDILLKEFIYCQIGNESIQKKIMIFIHH